MQRPGGRNVAGLIKALQEGQCGWKRVQRWDEFGEGMRWAGQAGRGEGSAFAPSEVGAPEVLNGGAAEG